MSRFKALTSSLKSTARIAVDALLEWHPSTLPMVPDKVITPEFLNHLLGEYGFGNAARRAVAIEVRTTDIQSVSSNCNNFIIEVDWEEGADMPATLFLKLPCPELATRWFCNVIRVWELECSFFRSFVDDFPVRLPTVYAVASHRSRFILLEEDLHANGRVTLHTNPDMMEGPSRAVAEQCLAALARIHAFYHDLPREEQERRLSFSTHPFLSPVMTEISRFINRMAVDPCRKKVPHSFPESTAQTFRLAMDHWDELLAWWYEGPLTLLHGDSHLGNFFVEGDEMGMIDFQAAHWGKGIRDVQYFLIDSLPVDMLAVNEHALVRFYTEQLAEQGVQLSFDTAWEQYRAYSFQTLMTIVVSLGLGPLTEGDVLMSEITRRAVAACERVDFRGWLEQTIISG
jgi:hypothetical protein